MICTPTTLVLVGHARTCCGSEAILPFQSEALKNGSGSAQLRDIETLREPGVKRRQEVQCAVGLTAFGAGTSEIGGGPQLPHSCALHACGFDGLEVVILR